MKCPFCNSEETKVTNKRDAGDLVRRRRECLKCERRFTTYEQPEIEIVVIKKDGRREAFNEDKLRTGILKACEKRTVSRDKIEKAIIEIEERLRKKGREVKSSLIGELVMKSLKKIDDIAYIRFASVYREFKDIKDFNKEIKLIER